MATICPSQLVNAILLSYTIDAPYPVEDVSEDLLATPRVNRSEKDLAVMRSLPQPSTQRCRTAKESHETYPPRISGAHRRVPDLRKVAISRESLIGVNGECTHSSDKAG
jgi:hypothetical protein